MTGWLNSGGTANNPLSALTIKSLEDMNLQVDVNQADSYLVPGAGRRLRRNLVGAGQEEVPEWPTKTFIGRDIIQEPPQIGEAIPYPDEG